MENKFFKTFEYLLSQKYKIILLPIIISIIFISIFNYFYKDHANIEPRSFSYEIGFIDSKESFTKIDLVNLILNLSRSNQLSMNILSERKGMGFIGSEFNKKERYIEESDLKISFINKLKHIIFNKSQNNELNFPEKIISMENVNNNLKLKFIYQDDNIELSKNNLTLLLSEGLETVNEDWHKLLEKENNNYYWKVDKNEEYYDFAQEILIKENNEGSFLLNKAFEKLTNEIIEKNIKELYENDQMIDIIDYNPLYFDVEFNKEIGNFSILRFSLAVYLFLQFFIILYFVFLFEYNKFYSNKT